MIRLLLRLMLLLTGLLTATILLVRMQPHDDRSVAALFVTDNCTAPCFLGIQPDETPVSDAINLLKNQQWVQNVEERYTDFGQSTNTFWGYVYWQWKPDSPFWTHAPTFKSGIHDAYLRILDGRVNEIAFTTGLSFGDVVLSAGQGGSYVLDQPDRYGEKPYSVIQHFYFPKLGLAFGSVSICPAIRPDWNQGTVVTVWSKERFAGYMQVLPMLAHDLPQARLIARAECK